MRTLSFLAVFCFGFASFAQTTKPLNPLIFSIEKNGEAGVIFGTFHLLTVDEVPQYVVSALKKAPVFVSEWNYSKNPIPQSNSADEPKVGPLSTETAERIKERGLPVERVPSWSPGKACSAYIFFESYKRVQAAGGTVDQKLEELAVEGHKELVQLDRADLSAKIMDKIERGCDLDKLTSTLPPMVAKLLQEKTLSDFKSGDLSKIPSGERGNVAAVTERNLDWISKIKETLPRGAFIAVGAGHLGGEQGLLKLLAKQGYRIERVRSQLDVDLLELDRRRP